jgi:hypothetical protein
MKIPRCIKNELLHKLQPQKVVVLYGPRQVGKTTLLNEVLSESREPYLFLSGEDVDTQTWLSSRSLEKLKQHIGNTKLVVIDEAQKVDQIGLNLKLLVDHIPEIRILATGSSSFELANQVGEPLVGRKWQFLLYPIAQMEMTESEAPSETFARLETRLRYGCYPAVITSPHIDEKREILESIVDNYLYRDLLEHDEIRKSQKIIDILKLLAFQIGSEVSLHELGTSVQLDMKTVERYLDLLEKVFVIKRVYGFSRNLRKEVTKTSRYYFLDNGIRNAIINNFNDFTTRDDVGQLWENYLFVERLKKQEYHKIFANTYFWRTWDKKEIDLVEERDGKLYGYEFKWGKKTPTAPKDWIETYENAEYEVVNKENYLSFIA